MRFSFAAILAGAAFTASLPAAQLIPDPKALEDQRKQDSVKGGYVIASGERDGQPMPKEFFKDAIVRIVDGKIVATDRNSRAFLAESYSLDTSKEPWGLKLESIAPSYPTVSDSAPKEKQTSQGLIKVDGSTVTLIYSLPGGPAPTEFKTRAGQQMLVLKTFASQPPLPLKFSQTP